MKKQELIPIGVLSKITNVHIQSLRYYEKIGILTPAYIDEGSGYRYYSFSQIRIVEAIQYCVELDIPLKDFHVFVSDAGQTIDYAVLISYGKKAAQEKIESIQNKVRHFDALEMEMLHSRDCAEDAIVPCVLPEKTYYLMPYCGTQAEPAFRRVAIRLLDEVHSNGYKTGYDLSLLAIYTDGSIKQYIGTDLLYFKKGKGNDKNILCIPETTQYCLKRSRSGILSAPDIFSQYIKNVRTFIVIETDLFTEVYSYGKPSYEIRCVI
ncbi:MAG: MerR family transcriptional regulator [Eubacteriales bacterium]|nr:MerR family transcriptional regulator [Eubacteriales bacterium]